MLGTILGIGEIAVTSSSSTQTPEFVEIAIFFTYSIAPLSYPLASALEWHSTAVATQFNLQSLVKLKHNFIVSCSSSSIVILPFIFLIFSSIFSPPLVYSSFEVPQ